jgi:hypothetical protein
VALSDHRELPIEPYRGSLLTLLRPGNPLGTFDLIYSAGLYDYLSADVALRLTAKLATMLKPEGRLLIANMLPGLPARRTVHGSADGLVAGLSNAAPDQELVFRPGS